MTKIIKIHSNIRLFADDTTIYIIVDFPDSAAQILNIDLERIVHWAAKWLVGFNAKKTEALLISRRLCRLNHRTLFFNHVPIPESSFTSTWEFISQINVTGKYI